jgi:hypothetical protein
MTDPTDRLSSRLDRAVQNEDTPELELPPEVRSQIADVDFEQLLDTAQRALDDFTQTVFGEENTVELVGVTIVGSFLSREFKPQQSDLDIYFLTNEAYKDDEAFCRTVRDPSSEYYHRLSEAVPDTIASVDVLGLYVEGDHWNDVEDPTLTFTRSGV